MVSRTVHAPRPTYCGRVSTKQRRVGVLGGTFDPPHVAHVVLAAEAIQQLLLDELIVTVAGVPWQKVDGRTITEADIRLRMAEAAFEPVQGVVVSDIELRREGDTYTVDTLEYLSSPDTDLFLLLGADTAAGFDTWERPNEVAQLASIAVFPRRGCEDAKPPEGFDWTTLKLPGLEISSTDIRRRVSEGRPIAGMVPPKVADIVADQGLFQTR